MWPYMYCVLGLKYIYYTVYIIWFKTELGSDALFPK